MSYVTASEIAERWGVTPRVVRGYCESGRVPGAFQDGRAWSIPDDAEKPARKRRSDQASAALLERLRAEKEERVEGGIYQQIQVEFTYNSNRIEGSSLTLEQTRHIFETNTLGIADPDASVDDIVETVNHFSCIDHIIDNANRTLSERMIKQLHLLLKSGTSDCRKSWFAVGEYKRLWNEVGGRSTASPEEVPERMAELVDTYNALPAKGLGDLIAFHAELETIHPFQDGNGRVGRLVLFKECLKNGIVPFVIDDEMRSFYFRGLAEWKREPGYLTDTCLAAQDAFKERLDSLGIPY